MRVEISKPAVMRPMLLMAILLMATAQSSAATARKLPLNTGEFVNVNVGISIQMPIVDDSEQALINMQEEARKFIYRMASRECGTLKATIAKTCRMTNLNISSQIRDQGDRRPSKLYLNGNAQFSITLKEEAAN